MALRAGERLGPYEILGALGAGGMGEVYRARDPRLGRTVALKVLPPDVSSDRVRRHRFEHEARATGRLNHPNILAVYDVGDHDGAPYLVTELLDGETLRERLRSGPIPVRKALDHALQTARGLAAAHDKGIVHRDVKPENLFVTKDGIVKILDFGLARQTAVGAGEDTHSPTLTRDTEPGVLVGTVAYMSPEQARGETVDHRSDIFALGSVLYEMLSGRRPFSGETAADAMSAILRGEPPELPEERQVLPPVDRAVRHCLEKRPEDRYQSARDLAFELEGLGGSSTTTEKAAQVATGARRRRWLAAGLAAVVALAALASAFVAGRRTAPSSIPTYRQITFRSGFAPSGRFTTDGKTVVYSAAWDGGPPQIYSLRTDAPESKRLDLPPGHVASVSSRGELALLLTQHPVHLDGVPATLARVPLSGGTPRPVAEDVLCAEWSPDGQELAVWRVVDGKARLEFPLGHVVAEPGSCPRFSPRGDRLAFGIPDGYQIIETSTGKSTLIEGVPERFHGTFWAWSPDGTEIWFSASDVQMDRPLEAVSLSGRRRVLDRIAGAVSLFDVSREGVGLVEHAFARWRVFARSPGDSRERELSVFDRTFATDISSDGRTVLLMEQGAAVRGTVAYLRSTDGSPAMRLSEGAPTSLSPDGRWVLVVQDGLRLVPIGAGETRAVPTPGLELRDAVWVPDGKRVLLLGREPDRGWRIFVLDLEGGPRRAVTPEGVRLFTSFCSDGLRVACVGPANRLTLYPLEGGEGREVPGLEPGMRPLRFTGDGRALIVGSAGETLPRRIYQVDLATGRQRLLHELIPPDPAGATSHLTVVTPDAQGYAITYRQILHNLYLVQGVS